MDCLGLQGAELMGKYGINVPRGAAAGSVQEVNDALKNMFPSEKEVMTPQLLHLLLFDPLIMFILSPRDPKCSRPWQCY
jgi:hypothetical protein